MALEHRKNTKRVVIHHSASAPGTTMEQVDSWHKNKGWTMIGYHYFIEADGKTKIGRPDWAVGAHAIGANFDSLGICLAGNFETAPPTQAQMTALAGLIKDIRKAYGNIPVIGHFQVDPKKHPTACPGKLFPWGDMKESAEAEPVSEWGAKKQSIVLEAKNKELITGEHNPDDPAPKWFVLQVALNVMKKSGGK